MMLHFIALPRSIDFLTGVKHHHWECRCLTDPNINMVPKEVNFNNDVQGIYTYVYAYIYIYGCICLHIYVYIYIYIRVYVYKHIYVCVYIYICMYLYIYVCIYICVCIYIYVCMYMYVYIYMYVYTYIYSIWSFFKDTIPPFIIDTRSTQQIFVAAQVVTSSSKELGLCSVQWHSGGHEVGSSAAGAVPPGYPRGRLQVTRSNENTSVYPLVNKHRPWKSPIFNGN